ncbi:MAG: SDR family NAD(P)-dependent oxidoreductase [Desulfobacterales bacterium]
MNIPERVINPEIQMFEEALGKAPGRGRMENRHVLVVGAGQRKSDDPDPPPGNGRAISILAAREGAKVVCADINMESAAETADMIRAEGYFAESLAADVAKPDDIKYMVDEAKNVLGKLDSLILNVGISHGMPLDKVTMDEWDLELSVNLRSHAFICQEAMPVMETGGSIVLISSLASQRPTGRNPAYECSKAAQIALAKNVALTGQPRGIRCNVVAPGLIDTPLGRRASARRSDRAVLVPFGRQGTGWEVAYPSIFLASSESSYINGQSIFVDGGLGVGIAQK